MSSACAPPSRPLIQREVYGQSHDDGYRDAVQVRRLKLPLLDGLESGLVEQRLAPEYASLCDVAERIDRRLDDDHALNARVHRDLRVNRFDVPDFHWRLDVSADPDWRLTVDELGWRGGGRRLSGSQRPGPPPLRTT